MKNLNVKKLIIMGAISTSMALTTASCGTYYNQEASAIEKSENQEDIEKQNTEKQEDIEKQNTEKQEDIEKQNTEKQEDIEKQNREDKSLEWFKKQIITNDNLDNTNLSENWNNKVNFDNAKLESLFAYIDNEILENEEYTVDNDGIIRLSTASNYGNFSFEKIRFENNYIDFIDSNGNNLFCGIYGSDKRVYYRYVLNDGNHKAILNYTPSTKKFKICITFNGKNVYDKCYNISSDKNIDMMEQLLRLYNNDISVKNIYNNTQKIFNGKYDAIEGKISQTKIIESTTVAKATNKVDKDSETLEWLKKQFATNGNLNNTDLKKDCKHKIVGFESKKLKKFFAYVDNEILEKEACRVLEDYHITYLITPSNYGNFSFKKIEVHDSYLNFWNNAGARFKVNLISSDRLFSPCFDYTYDFSYDATNANLVYCPYFGELKMYLNINGVTMINRCYTIPSDKNLDMMDQLVRLYNKNVDAWDIYDNINEVLNCQYDIEYVERKIKTENKEKTIDENNISNIEEKTIDDIEIKALDINNPYNKFISTLGIDSTQTEVIDKETVSNLTNELNPSSSDLKEALPYLINIYLQSKEDLDDSVNYVMENKSLCCNFNDYGLLLIDIDNIESYNGENYKNSAINIITKEKNVVYCEFEDKKRTYYLFQNNIDNCSLIYYPYNNKLSLYGNGESNEFAIPTEMKDAMINEIFKYYENNLAYEDILGSITNISNGINSTKEKVYSKK